MAGPAAAEVREPKAEEDAEPVEIPGSDVVDSDGPAAAEVREPSEEALPESAEMREPVAEDVVDSGVEDVADVDVEDRVGMPEARACPVPTFWTLDQTSRFSKKSEARTGIAALEVNFTP